MTYDNNNGPIYSILANKGDACGFHPVDGSLQAGYNGNAESLCPNMPPRASEFVWENGECKQYAWMAGCIVTGDPNMGNSDSFGNQIIGFDSIYQPSTDPESGFALNYPNGQYGTCGYRRYYNGSYNPCEHSECTSSYLADGGEC